MDADELTIQEDGPRPGPPDDSVPAKLVMLQGPLCGKIVDIRGSRLRIGRHSENDLVLASQGVSRHHACILAEGGRFVIEDLGSSNGSSRNERRIQTGSKETLEHQDVLSICDHEMLFLKRGGQVGKLDLATISLDHTRIRGEAEQALRDFLASPG